MRNREDTRQLMAATALEGLLAKKANHYTGSRDMTGYQEAAREALRHAEALLWELEETGRICQWRYDRARESWFTDCESEIATELPIGHTNFTYCPVCGHQIDVIDEEAA